MPSFWFARRTSATGAPSAATPLSATMRTGCARKVGSYSVCELAVRHIAHPASNNIAVIVVCFMFPLRLFGLHYRLPFSTSSSPAIAIIIHTFARLNLIEILSLRTLPPRGIDVTYLKLGHIPPARRYAIHIEESQCDLKF